MAIFSLFTGLIYNEAFSIPLSIFGHSSWKCPSDPSISLIDIRTNEELCPAAYTTGLTQVLSRNLVACMSCLRKTHNLVVRHGLLCTCTAICVCQIQNSGCLLLRPHCLQSSDQIPAFFKYMRMKLDSARCGSADRRTVSAGRGPGVARLAHGAAVPEFRENEDVDRPR